VKREERLFVALQEVAQTSDHVNHGYLICGKCMAQRALDADALTAKKPKEKKP
jgi:hypothetical protein